MENNCFVGGVGFDGYWCLSLNRSCSGSLINCDSFHRRRVDSLKTVAGRTDDYLDNRVRDAVELEKPVFVRMRADDDRLKMARASRLSHKLYLWGF